MGPVKDSFDFMRKQKETSFDFAIISTIKFLALIQFLFQFRIFAHCEN